MAALYHAGARRLQDRFDTRRLADRLAERLRREALGDASRLAFPSYDGNGMFRSLGNLLVNPHVGSLFIDFATGRRLRVQGRATLVLDDPLVAESVPVWKRSEMFRDVLAAGDPAREG